jgi:hypothetical protein
MSSLGGVVVCTPVRGYTISFWDDLIKGALETEIYPNLHGFAKNPRISLWNLRQSEELLNFFHIPMTRADYNESLLLKQFLDDVLPVSQDGNDSWSFSWGQHIFSSSKYYQHQFKDIHP